METLLCPFLFVSFCWHHFFVCSFRFHPFQGNVARRLASIQKEPAGTMAAAPLKRHPNQETRALQYLALEDKAKLKCLCDTVKTFPVKHIIEPTPTPTNTKRTDTILNLVSKLHGCGSGG